MKTNVYFEPSDFINGGQMIIRQSSTPGSKDVGFAASVAYKIGWTSRGNTIMMISLSDGMCIDIPSIEKLCESLNTDAEGYRPMTLEEIHAIATFNGNRF